VFVEIERRAAPKTSSTPKGGTQRDAPDDLRIHLELAHLSQAVPLAQGCLRLRKSQYLHRHIFVRIQWQVFVLINLRSTTSLRLRWIFTSVARFDQLLGRLGDIFLAAKFNP